MGTGNDGKTPEEREAEKRFIISSVVPIESSLTATDKMLELIDADMNKK